MFGLGTELIDVAIGLVLMYTVVSLIASAVVELLETLMRTRAKYLWQGIGELLDDPQTRVGRSGKPAAQPQEDGDDTRIVDKSTQKPSKRKRGNGKAQTTATHAVSAEHSAARTPISVETFYEHPLIAALFYGDYTAAASRLASRQLPPYIPKESFSTAIIDLVSRDQQGDAHLSAVERLRRGVEALPPSSLKTALESIRRVTGDDLTLVQRRIEGWYDTAMNSTASWYKRRAQVLLVVVGLVLAAIGNLDSWRIAKNLASDKTRREAIAANATRFVETRTPETLTLKKEDLDNLDSFVILKAGDITFFSPLGWLITALAVSMGAPFWFDLLNKFVTLRSSVKPKSADPDSGSTGTPVPAGTQGPTVFVR